MQIIDHDKIRVTYAEGDRNLYELMNGAFQYGTGSEAQLITSLEEVAMFPKFVQDRVAAWLGSNGIEEAKKDKKAILLAEQAKGSPGVLDTLARELGGEEMLAEMLAMFKDFLKQNGRIPAKEPVESEERLDTGKLVLNQQTGNREFIPDESMLDDVIKREMQLDADIAAGRAEAPDTADLVGVGAPQQGATVADDIARGKKRKR